MAAAAVAGNYASFQVPMHGSVVPVQAEGSDGQYQQYWFDIITGRLEAMLLEAKGLWAKAEKAYSSLQEDNLPDHQVIQKRMATTEKAEGNLSGAIEWLNKYLEIFMADHDAWRELAEIYVSPQMYKQAAFCYEELILSQPTNPLYHLAYADVSSRVTQGYDSIVAREWYAELPEAVRDWVD
ncbi:ER membrane protein complex subunit 2-like [Camellia sinensis]|uniref:ER membrane protein complex subunit 2-like n=1 Tax=Camellia sinensis TaxID=4442 RepID=UPI001035784A|nr:ER membrane protein complex subunit 2-like [Camellia sinensis]